MFLIKESWNDKGEVKHSFSRLFRNYKPSEEVLSAFIFGKYPHCDIQIHIEKNSSLPNATVYDSRIIDGKSKLEFVVIDDWKKEEILKCLTHKDDIEYIKQRI